MSYLMWMNVKGDWERGQDGRPLLVSEEHALNAIRSHKWTQVRFIPETKADTFERERRAEIERREELAVHGYNARLIETYYGGVNIND